MEGSNLQVVYRAVADLKPYARNARTHSDAQIDQIAASIREFGFTNPILVGPDLGIIAGHGRLEGAKRVGMEQVPTIELAGLTDSQRKALVLADNRIAESSGWDDKILSLELADLHAAGFDQFTGFTSSELSNLLGGSGSEPIPPEPATPEMLPSPVSVIGDLWILGSHRLLCADSTDSANLARLVDGVIPDVANCDPPYGISAVKGGSIGGGGMTRFRRVHGRAKNQIIEPGVYAPIIGDDTTDTAVASHDSLVRLGVPIMALWGGQLFCQPSAAVTLLAGVG